MKRSRTDQPDPETDDDSSIDENDDAENQPHEDLATTKKNIEEFEDHFAKRRFGF